MERLKFVQFLTKAPANLIGLPVTARIDNARSAAGVAVQLCQDNYGNV